jgi:hypothetical protein
MAQCAGREDPKGVVLLGSQRVGERLLSFARSPLGPLYFAVARLPSGQGEVFGLYVYHRGNRGWPTLYFLLHDCCMIGVQTTGKGRVHQSNSTTCKPQIPLDIDFLFCRPLPYHLGTAPYVLN